MLAAMLLVLAGCHNACQGLCKEMDAYARDCGFTPPDGQLDACIQDHSGDSLTDDQLQTCRDQADSLRSEWSCDDVSAYFDR